ncbi:MAG: thioredoxin family protein [Chthoniobacterales bacterium]
MSTQTMTLEKTDSLTGHEVVSRSEWLIARKDLLEREKELTHFRDQVAAERRALPWVKIEKEYTFDGPEGEVTLAELFDGRSQLFIKHFMMAPGQQTQCVGCSLEVDHTEGILPHLENHDVTYVAVARAPIEEIEAVRKRMGWKFRWVSSYHSDFNYDFNVSFTHQDAASGRAIYNFGVLPEWATDIEDLSGDSVFYKDDAGQIFHTYSTFGRGGEEFLGIYRFLDATPKGRGENGPYHSLTDWARPRNMYGKGATVEPTGRYHQPACACEAHQSAA